jgi:diacylglycerol diphosphate phosphatase/phosphatidate phosphatase
MYNSLGFSPMETQDYPVRRKFFNLKNFKYHWIDTVIAVVLWTLGVVLQQYAPPFHRYFTERDPSLSYPYITAVQVPTWLLICLCWLVPALCITFSQYLVYLRFGEASRNHKAAKFFLAQIVLFQALGLTLFLTSSTKAFFGRHRPNFFAFCNYKGFMDAQTSGNYSEYDSLTVQGMPGDISYCRASPADIKESMFSYPSGHASMSFAGLGFLSLFLLHLLLSHRPTRRNHLWKAIVFTIPMFIAMLVAATRTRDYWHNFDDTIMGSLLGFGCATLAFYMNYSRTTSYNVEYIGDLFPGQESDLSQGELGLLHSKVSPELPTTNPSLSPSQKGGKKF